MVDVRDLFDSIGVLSHIFILISHHSLIIEKYLKSHVHNGTLKSQLESQNTRSQFWIKSLNAWSIESIR